MNTFSHHVHGVRVIHMKFKTRSNALKISDINFVCIQHQTSETMPMVFFLCFALSFGWIEHKLGCAWYLYVFEIHSWRLCACYYVYVCVYSRSFSVSFFLVQSKKKKKHFCLWFDVWQIQRENKQCLFFGVCYHHQHLRFRIIRSGCEW